jgi:hypothetical protein
MVLSGGNILDLDRKANGSGLSILIVTRVVVFIILVKDRLGEESITVGESKLEEVGTTGNTRE